MRQWSSTAFSAGTEAAAAHVRVPTRGLEVSFEAVDSFPQALREEWEALELEAGEPNSFAQAWFVAASLRHLAPDQAVRLAQVRNNGRLIGTALFHCVRDYGRAPIPHVENWVHCNQFVGTQLIRRGEEETFWHAVLAALDGAAWAPAFLHLTKIVEDGPIHRGLEAASRAQGRSCEIVDRRSRAFLETERSPEEYLTRNLSRRCRSELNRRRKRLAELGRLEMRCLAATDDPAGWCDEFLALERAGWKGQAGSALACSPARAAFFREAVAGAHAKERLHFLRLDLDGRAIAMLSSFLAPPGAFGFKAAFDEKYSRFSPGMLLQIENLEMLRRPDIDWTDSCSSPGHPTVDGLWSERRCIVRLTVRLMGARRLIPFAAARALERASDFRSRQRKKERVAR